MNEVLNKRMLHSCMQTSHLKGTFSPQFFVVTFDDSRYELRSVCVSSYRCDRYAPHVTGGNLMKAPYYQQQTYMLARICCCDKSSKHDE